MTPEPDTFAWQPLPDGGAAVRWPADGGVGFGELDAARRAWLAAGVRYAQVFLPLPLVSSTETLAAVGLRPLTVLELHRRPVRPTDSGRASTANGLTLRPFDRLDPAVVKATLTRTYVGSLDGPELNALRLDDAPLEETGGLAVVAFRGPEPVGVLQLQSSGDGSLLEFAYLGVVPEARRTGVAAALVEFALATPPCRPGGRSCSAWTRETPRRRPFTPASASRSTSDAPSGGGSTIPALEHTFPRGAWGNCTRRGGSRRPARLARLVTAVAKVLRARAGRLRVGAAAGA